jgi:hypothetical protein
VRRGHRFSPACAWSLQNWSPVRLLAQAQPVSPLTVFTCTHHSFTPFLVISMLQPPFPKPQVLPFSSISSKVSVNQTPLPRNPSRRRRGGRNEERRCRAERRIKIGSRLFEHRSVGFADYIYAC